MSLEITFKLSDEDLEHFRKILDDTKKQLSNLSSETIINNAKSISESIDDSVPEFISSRLANLDVLVSMAEDEQWDLEQEEKDEIMCALAYFSNEQDMIADDVPVLGLLDDAIMIELVSLDLQEDFEAYNEFCKFRETSTNPDPTKQDWLDTKRRELYSRMRTRRRSRRSGGTSGFKGIFR
jgi:uncharacterized membrane protein YkvA (DUF1232 family)